MRRLFLLIFLLYFISISSQNKRNNIWYFGTNAGLDFNSGVFPPTPISGAMNTGEGSATICNSAGQLLFYSNGFYIWDRTHTPMPRAGGVNYSTNWDSILSGHPSSTESVLISRFPCDTNKYFVFTVDGSTCPAQAGDPKGKWDGLYYTVVNMNLNGGLGDIDINYLSTLPGYVAGSNKISLTDTVNEKVTAIPHKNGVDYWVVVQRLRKPFYAYLVDCNGINNTPVISINPLLSGNAGGGALKSSHDGKSIVIANAGIINSASVAQLADFDNSTGVISNFVTLRDAGYGACFSPDDKTIYLSDFGNIHRFDRYALNVPASIITHSLSIGGVGAASLYNGPDDRMYIAPGLISGTLSVYNTPNNFANPGLLPLSVSNISGCRAYYGLQNIYYPNPKISLRDTVVCKGDSVDIGLSSVTCATYQWTPSHGLRSTTESNPQASPSVTTKYYLKMNVSCYELIDSLTVTVTQTPVNISGSNAVCQGMGTTLTVTGGTSYVWSNGATTNTISVTPTSNVSYTVTAYNGQCSDTSSVNLTMFLNPVVQVTGDESICISDSSSITAVGANNYQWSPSVGISSSTGSTIMAGPSANQSYTVLGSDVNGCTSVTTFSISVLSTTVIAVGTATIGLGESTAISSLGNYSQYLWSPSTGLSCNTCKTTLASPSFTTKYYLLVTDHNGCTSIDSVTIFVEQECVDPFIPNVFSPNDDGENDVLTVYGNALSNNVLIIYDRWGRQVFVSYENKPKWDGTFNGKKLNSDVFIYKWLYKCNETGKVLEKKGTITIVR